MPRYVHPVDDMVFACPDCDEAGSINRRKGTQQSFENDLLCTVCGAEFDKAVERKSKNPLKEGHEGGATDEHGLPATLDPKAKEIILAERGDD